MGLIWGVRGGRGSLEQGVPRRCKLSGGERRWWSRGAAEGAGKGVEGAHGVGAELGVVSQSSEGDQGGGLRWFNDCSTTAQWQRRGGGPKRVVHRGGGVLL
jgi:hypothetical protein